MLSATRDERNTKEERYTSGTQILLLVHEQQQAGWAGKARWADDDADDEILFFSSYLPTSPGPYKPGPYYQYRNCSTWLAQLNQGRACLARQATVPAPSASTNSLSGQPQSSLPRQAIVPARSASTKSPSGQPRSSLPRPHLCAGSTGWLDVAANDSSND